MSEDATAGEQTTPRTVGDSSAPRAAGAPEAVPAEAVSPEEHGSDAGGAGAAVRPITVGFIGPVGVQAYSFRRYARELSEALARQPGVTVRHVAQPGPAGTERRQSGFLPRQLAGRFRRWLMRRARRVWRRPPAAIREFEADVYHLPAPGDAWMIRHLRHDRAVVTLHDLLAGAGWSDAPDAAGPTRMPGGQSGRYFESLRSAARVVCVSELARRELEAYHAVPPEQVRVILNGLHPRFHELAPERVGAVQAGLPPARYRILQLSSSNDPRKNTAAVLRVLRALLDEGLDVRLVRVGAYLSLTDHALAEELGVLERVEEHGRVDDEELVELYNAADVLLFPSLHEGFGWPPLEAMACGTPVVASNIEACREVLGDAGLLADPRDVAALTGHVRSVLLDEGVAAEQHERGLARAGAFSWERAAEQFAALYREVLDEAPAGDGR